MIMGKILKVLASASFHMKQYLWTEKTSSHWFNCRYHFLTLLGFIKGFILSLRGHVIFENKWHPLVIGRRIDYFIEPGSSIVIRGDRKHRIDDELEYSLFKNASYLGFIPHWKFMNLPRSRNSSLRLQKESKLVLLPNTLICRGCYISIWPHKELILGENTYIGPDVLINTRCGMSIGDNVVISHGVTIWDYDGHPVYDNQGKGPIDSYGGEAKAITIESDVWIGYEASILKGVRIGKGAIIGAKSCVTKDVLPNTIVAGNPATVIRRNITWRKY